MRGKDGTGARIKRYYDGSYKGINCINYEPCPVCYRCENKDETSEECKKCDVKGDYHKTEDKVLLIKRGDDFEGEKSKRNKQKQSNRTLGK